MAQNTNNLSFDAEGNVNLTNNFNNVSSTEENSSGSKALKTFQSTLNFLAHLLIGAVVGVCVIFVFREGLPLGATPLHIVLCVFGYQLLMAQAILSMSPSNGWTASLRLVDKKRVHTILQILGSVLALVGSIIKVLDKDIHWNTIHGQFALVAMVFTVAGLFNGCASLYAHELRKILPGSLSKITHICFGIVAYSASCITLCYGFDKPIFTNWASSPVAYTIIGFIGAYTFIVITDPVIDLFTKSVRVFKK